MYINVIYLKFQYKRRHKPYMDFANLAITIKACFSLIVRGQWTNSGVLTAGSRHDDVDVDANPKTTGSLDCHCGESLKGLLIKEVLGFGHRLLVLEAVPTVSTAGWSGNPEQQCFSMVPADF